MGFIKKIKDQKIQREKKKTKTKTPKHKCLYLLFFSGDTWLKKCVIGMKNKLQ
jgi:hypothetical protein